MPPTYTWCPFYLRPCPSDILSPPLTCTLMSTLNHISKFPSKSQAAGFIIKWLCCWSKRPNLHSGDKEVSQLQSTCRGSRPGPGLVLPGWKVAVSSEAGRDRGEHERAEWKCTRGHLRPTWTPANGCTFWWRQLPQSSNGRVYSINSLRVGKFRGEKKKRGCETSLDWRRQPMFTSRLVAGQRGTSLWFNTKEIICGMRQWGCCDFLWLNRTWQLFISRNNHTWVRNPPSFFSSFSR